MNSYATGPQILNWADYFVEGLSFACRRDKELLTFVEFVEGVGVRPHKGEWIPERIHS